MKHYPTSLKDFIRLCATLYWGRGWTLSAIWNYCILIVLCYCILILYYFKYKFLLHFLTARFEKLHWSLWKMSNPKRQFKFRSSHQRCSVNRGVLRNFTKFLRHLSNVYFKQIFAFRIDTIWLILSLQRNSFEVSNKKHYKKIFTYSLKFTIKNNRMTSLPFFVNT